MKTIQTTTPETFKAAIQQNEYAIGALLVLYSHQTTDEQIRRSTKYQNDLGFNGTDGGFCSSLVEQYLRNGRLTERQMVSVKKLLPKYHAQVKEISPKPIAVSVPSEAVKQPKLAKIMKDIIQVSFPYDPNTVEKVKEISGRAWKKELKVWTVPLNGDSVEKLLELNFEIDPKVVARFQEKEDKNIINFEKIRLDFSLCPLYNGSWQEYIINQREEDYAKRSLSKNGKPTESSKEKSCEGEDKGSKRESDCDHAASISNRRVQGKRINRDEKSYEKARCQKKTSEGVGESKEDSRNQLSWREWTAIDLNSEDSQQAIIKMWLHNGISNKYPVCEEYVRKCGECIQSRLCQSENKGCYRIGRPESRKEEKGGGREENESFGSPWVDCNTLAALQSIKAIPGLIRGLYKYQLEDVSLIDKKKGRILIGSEMGLGKTLQALSWIQLRKDIATPAIILCPASAKLSWAREALKFTQLNPVTISGRKKKAFKAFTEVDKDLVYIINYDILFDYQECEFCKGTKLMHGEKCKKCNGKGKIPVLHKDIKKLGIQTVIIDEYHYLKTNGTARTESAKDLCKLAKHVVPMSGTPIEQKPIEIYNAIQITNPNIFPSWWAFTKEYCDRKRTPFGWDFSGASNTKELHAILTKKLMIRRMKKEVLPELPPIIRSVVPIEINLNSYNKIVAEAQEALEKADAKAQHLTIIEKAKQAVVQLKMKDALSWVQDYIDSGQKIVVFAEHRDVVDQIADHFGKIAVRLYGGISQKAAQEAVDRFQTDPSCMVFVGSRSAKENHTLTAAAATCFFELWWMSTWHDQAEARVSRIGQVADTTFAYYLLAADTIEEDIAEMLDRKRAIVSAVLDGNDVEEEHMLSNLINKINGEK